MLPYRDPSLTPEQRTADLIGRMHDAELLAQLGGRLIPYGRLPGRVRADGRADLEADFAAGIAAGTGCISYVNMGLDPAQGLAWTNALQRHLVENTRLGIPALFAEECAFGHIACGATCMPPPPALGASFDAGLVERVYAAVAAETRARGGSLAHTPIADQARDPRWGRANESFGEDVLLVSTCVAAAVRGLQGGADGVHPGGLAATIKHFAGFGLSHGGRQMGTVDCGRQALFDEVLPPYRAAIDAGVAAVMPAYHEIDGMPCHGNRRLLTDVLRRRWGFQGVVTADYGGVDKLADMFRVAADDAESALRALAAGVDMDLPEGRSYPTLATQLAQPGVREMVVAAVRRVLLLKFRLGLFDQPFGDPAALERVGGPLARQAAEDAAIAGTVLLCNQGLLPLAGVQRIAVVGPHATVHHLGADRPHRVRIVDGIRAAAPAGATVVAARGCRITTRDDDQAVYLAETAEQSLTRLQAQDRDPELARRLADQRALEMPHGSEDAEIAHAAGLARTSDVAVVCLGESPWMTGENYTPARRCDRDRVHLLGNQLALLRAVRATGVKVVAVVVSGRALAIAEVAELADAVLWVWDGGQARGTAVGRILFGQAEPGGHLPFTLPIAPGAVPIPYNQRRGGSLRSYACAPEDRLYAFPFGHGLTFTSFAIASPQAVVAADGGLMATAIVTNTGTRSGTALVQAYVSDRVSSIVRPDRVLGGWTRVHLSPGERRQVTIAVNPSALAIHDEHGRPGIEPGQFGVGIGLSSADLAWTEVQHPGLPHGDDHRAPTATRGEGSGRIAMASGPVATANPFAWKPDWPLTRQRFCDWWAGSGTLVASIWPPTQTEAVHPGWQVDPVADVAWRYRHGAWRGREQMDYLARMRFPGDTLPASSLGFGPGCLGIFAQHGCIPHPTDRTVWFHPVWDQLDDPSDLPPPVFDADGSWWRTCVELHETFGRLAAGRAMPVIPDLGCGLDILASLRGVQPLLRDLVDRPEWVLGQQEGLLELWSQVFDRCVRLSPADGGNACESYRVWGPGRTAMFFCDFAAMISPRMFKRFEAPFLERGCARVDHSYFHLDGHECLGILDSLLEIPRLGAIEWTPSPNRPHGASPCYDAMIQRIRQAGKSVILIEIPPEAVIPLFDRIGAHGLYIHTDLKDPRTAEALLAAVDRYR